MDASYRERSEKQELDILSPRAQLVSRSRGRAVAEPEDEIRTAYQRDRDRIVHSKAFRRLAHKTQVFLAPEGDHYRVRLTHTLEVTQVARTIARALRSNEDLVEAICLGHDLGHTPFGHQGEHIVAQFHPGFRHNLQSVRIVDVLERLNLTWEVRDGIANHTWSMQMPISLEGQIARYADRIAYINHDIDDAIRAGILAEGELPDAALEVLGDSHSRRIHTMVADLIDASAEEDTISMSAEVFDAMGATREFLFERVYLGRGGPPTPEAVELIVQGLLDHFEKQGVPNAEGFGPSESGSANEIDARVRAVDYVAGMTDRFALKAFESVFGELPHGVGVLG